MERVQGYKDQLEENIQKALAQGFRLDKSNYESNSFYLRVNPGHVTQKTDTRGRDPVVHHDYNPSIGRTQYKSSSKNCTPGTAELHEVMKTVELNWARRRKDMETKHKIGNGHRSEKSD